jgi:hypothetical protein
VNIAVTERAWVIVTVQVPVPVQAPLQPVKVEPVDAVAVRVTLVPLVKVALQVAPQLTPVGLEVTVPDPVPLLVRVRV